MTRLVRRIAITPAMALLATQIARLTRPTASVDGDSEETLSIVNECVRWGAGPRASQYIVLGAKARAAMFGSAMVRKEDVFAVAAPVLRHRMKLNFQAEASGVTVEGVIAEIVGQVEKTLKDSGSSEQISQVLRS